MQQPGITIIGAGPGGTYTALRLAQMGIPSTLIDRAQFPRTKACGDILTSNVLRALHALDPAIVAQLLHQPWVKQIQASAFVSAKGDRLLMPFHSPANAAMGLPSCLSARRADFDDFLLSYAHAHPLINVRLGMHLHEVQRIDNGFQLHFQGHAQPLEANYLVLATGGNSKLVRQMLPAHKIEPAHTAVGLRAYFTGALPWPEDAVSEFYLFDRKRMPGGLYITPFADGSVNVNLVMRYDVFQRTQSKLQETLQEYLASQPQLKARFANAKLQGNAEGATLFFGTRRRPLSAEGLLVVGDAAGLTDATNANGIGHAMISGGIAAETLGLALEAGKRDADFLRQYDRKVALRLQNALYPGKVMNFLFRNPATSRLTNFVLGSAFKRLNSKAVGELVYSSKTSRTLLNPRFYLRLFSKDKG
jgi:flavin-dependent dehydrogenase